MGKRQRRYNRHRNGQFLLPPDIPSYGNTQPKRPNMARSRQPTVHNGEGIGHSRRHHPADRSDTPSCGKAYDGSDMARNGRQRRCPADGLRRKRTFVSWCIDFPTSTEPSARPSATVFTPPPIAPSALKSPAHFPPKRPSPTHKSMGLEIRGYRLVVRACYQHKLLYNPPQHHNL